MSLKHIIVAMSGGVDSAVCAYLLKKAGHKVDAIFMKNWEEDDTQEHCAATQDLTDAKHVCEQLNIPLRTVNFSSEYWDHVFEYFLSEHRVGRTPNPDILCNTEIKFKAFLEFSRECGAEFIATGHYARLKHEQNRTRLLMAADKNKDQSYFLHGLNQQQLKQSLFPLGDMVKTQVRDIAQQLGLHIHNKKDSTGICFIGERKFSDFLKNYININQGDIVNTEGVVLGKHDGVNFYTIGQRQGLGIGGLNTSNEQPWYVVDKDLENNQLIVAQGNQHPALFNVSLKIEQMHWIDPSVFDQHRPIQAKIRYRQHPQNCHLRNFNGQPSQLILDFEQPQRAVTPGQYAVLYDQEQCLGGGIISERL